MLWADERLQVFLGLSIDQLRAGQSQQALQEAPWERFNELLIQYQLVDRERLVVLYDLLKTTNPSCMPELDKLLYVYLGLSIDQLRAGALPAANSKRGIQIAENEARRAAEMWAFRAQEEELRKLQGQDYNAVCVANKKLKARILELEEQVAQLNRRLEQAEEQQKKNGSPFPGRLCIEELPAPTESASDPSTRAVHKWGY